jgi:hypothetical protein
MHLAPPAEARGYLDYQNVPVDVGLGNPGRLDEALGALLFNGATAMIAIHYAVTAPEDEKYWALAAWILGAFAGFRGLTSILDIMAAPSKAVEEDE